MTSQYDAPDGTLPVRVFEPAAGRSRKGGVLFNLDAFGLRPELDGMCRRYAEAGWVTFLPDLYYRLGSPRFPVPGDGDPLDPNMVVATLARPGDDHRRHRRDPRACRFYAGLRCHALRLRATCTSREKLHQ